MAVNAQPRAAELLDFTHPIVNFVLQTSNKVVRTNYRRRGPWEHHEDWAYSLRNHKDYDVTVTVHVRVPATTYRFTCARPWKVLAVGLVEIDVPVKSNTAEKLIFSYDFNTRSGGGLQSPDSGD